MKRALKYLEDNDEERHVVVVNHGRDDTEDAVQEEGRYAREQEEIVELRNGTWIDVEPHQLMVSEHSSSNHEQ